MYAALKHAHLILAIVSILGFAIRAWWSYTEAAILQRKPVRILPHIVDTLFLLSGIGLVALASMPVLQSPWLLAKIAGLIAYVVIGTFAIRRGRTPNSRLFAAILSIGIFAYIVGAAVNRSALSWLA